MLDLDKHLLYVNHTFCYVIMTLIDFLILIMDDLLIKEPLDGSRINLREPYEVSYWCKKFNCTVTELQNAVHAVGTSATKVQAYLH